jgi:hypothetical protein
MQAHQPVERDNSAARFAQLLGRGELVFFAGAGVSYASGIPMNFAKEAASVFMPEDVELRPLVELVTDTLQQERFFEIARRVYADAFVDERSWGRVLHIWQGADPAKQAECGFECRQQPAHDALVAYSHRHALPIFTANVDCLFEAAAVARGIPYRVSVAFADACAPQSAASGAVEIVKFHGSIRVGGRLALDSLCCEMETITRPDPVLLARMTALASTHHLCFIGYSGRDLDYFQQLRARIIAGELRQPLWVDPAFEAGGDSPVQFSARSVGALRLGPAAMPWTTATANAPSHQILFDQLREEMRMLVPSEPGRRLLMLVLCLEGIGRYADALSAMLRYRDVARPVSELRAADVDLIHARLLDGVSRYIESERLASDCLRKTTSLSPAPEAEGRFVARCLAVRSIYQQSMSRKLGLVQPKLLRAMGARCIALLPGIFVELLIRQTWDTVTLAWLFSRLRRQAGANARPFARVQYILALRAWNDHRTALAAGLVRLRKLPFAGPRIRAWVQRLRDEAQFSGDFFGYVTAHKYLTQLDSAGSLAPQLASHLLLLTTDPLNRAASLMTDAASAATDKERQRFVDLALAAAGASGSHATVLKILLSEHSHGNAAEVNALALEARACSGKAFDLFASALNNSRRVAK